MTNAPRNPRETPDHRADRQAGYFRELADLNMQAARDAARRIDEANAAATPEKPADTAKQTLDLSRATRAVVSAVNAENALFRKLAPARAPVSDPRRAPLTDALHRASADRKGKARAEIRRDAETAVEEALVADPDAQITLHAHLYAIADRLGLALDPAKLSDEILGIEPRKYVRDG